MKIIFRVNKEKIIKMQWGLNRGDVSVKKEEFMNEVIQNDCEYIINRSLIKNSINKFTFDIEMFLTCSNEKGEAKKSKSQIKRICTRTK